MLQSILPLILFAFVATATPGIATTLSTASGAQFGFRRSVPLMIGSAAGLATVTGAAAAGLAGLLLAVPSLQLAMKVIGSLYLLWLALKIGRAGPPNLDVTMARPNSFLGGAGIQWMNPKGWAMITLRRADLDARFPGLLDSVIAAAGDDPALPAVGGHDIEVLA